ncbi:hypothetical protein MJO28_007046 [Puccinia striiformis f. sp. tritici]|uniref:Uncharacterized protein n=1 Tax=Puccinia striiformis f. sp. tritici TaxID=168172 RepID=A0ACC0ECW7_9BASI|nr:hypothetical protein Pst134EA_013144 [Puccinia striiformis f. sp. tritici]KAH9465253.1 hypothetical protein Pst134EA_013144 [Puccinia striiformis f. sp. tritici]KAI7951362.1 hypothetical protein MJO28_007046 [Puccinia striiformis f. sp. tritici]
MLSRITNSRSGSFAATIVWLQSITALLSLLAPVCAGRDHNVLTHLARRKLSKGSADHVPQTSIWSHYNTISGFNFFDSFTFINRWDNTTHSAAYYVDKAEAQKLSLAYVDENARAIIAVDTTKDISADVMPAVFLNTATGTFKYNRTALRSSVRLESLERYDVGTMVIADFHHTPYGCASWPAFWMHGEDWPKNGEIDIFEGWNDNTHGRATLHTTPNCAHDPTGTQTGKVLQQTCDSSVNWNAGCSVEDPTPDFYGPTLNKNGGAVFAAMYTTSEISVWRWRRQDVPDDIKSNNPRPELWPTPVATWKSGASCDIDKHFGPQNMIINIAMCGDSDLNTYAQGKCPGKCYDHLLKGSNYKEVYFAINSIKIFKGEPDAVSKPVTATAPGPKPVVPPPGLKPGKPVVPTVPKSPSPIPGKELPSSNTKPGGAAGPPPKDHS